MAEITDPSKYFYVCDGTVLKSLGDLRKALKTMSDGVYNDHASRDDWAKWVAEVVGDTALAKRLSGADRKKAIAILR